LPEKNIVEGLMRGIPVSEGIAIGKVWILESPWDEVVQISLKKGKIEKEVKRYQMAFKDVAQQLVECRDRVKREIGEEESKIFDVHLSILNDPFFQTNVPASIRSELKNAEFILKEGVETFQLSFRKMKNEYFRLRIDDIRDVAVRILRILLQSEDIKFSTKEPVILLSHNLAPSDTARIDKDHVFGFATELGGETSHASILARSMGLPAVVGIERLMKYVKNGDTIIVDGNAGIVYLDPPQRIVKGYQKRQQQFSTYWKRLSEDIFHPSITTDHVPVALQANIAMTADVSLAVRYQAEGIGLFRTELPFLIAGRLLTEEEQFKLYKTITEAMTGKNVTIRTLDLGGDKFLPFQDVEKEHNPFHSYFSTGKRCF
jgi:phosphotransferase system enzyme I (PtsI)